MSRPFKPTALKVVGGTDRKDRRNEHEPEPEYLFNLAAPTHLSERSAAVWDELAPMLAKMKVLTVADTVALELLCDVVADYRFARQHRGDKFVGTSPKTGSQCLSQWLIAEQMCRKGAEGLMAKFGMDPRARSQIFVDPQADLFGASAQGTPAAAPGGQDKSPSRFFPA